MSKLRRPKHHGLETGSSFPKQGQLLRQFSIAEIRSATQDFSADCVIVENVQRWNKFSVNFGKMYKGIIGTTEIAVKRWNSEAASEFKAELQLLPMLQHPNILCLIGYCTEDEEMILAYEYMPRGSLNFHLRGCVNRLSLSQRLKICIDVARALDYLHNGTSGQVVIYNNLKSSNILLDTHLAAKISDFGLSKVIPGDSLYTTTSVSTRVSTEVADRYGYTDPEYLATGILSKKSDMYSFGVVLLEVLCSHRNRVDQKRLVELFKRWMRKGKSEKIIDLIDPELRGRIPSKCLNEYAGIVKGCFRKVEERRVTMAEVVFGLESILTSYEKEVELISQMGITSYSKLQKKSFFSFRQNSGSCSIC